MVCLDDEMLHLGEEGVAAPAQVMDLGEGIAGDVLDSTMAGNDAGNAVQGGCDVFDMVSNVSYLLLRATGVGRKVVQGGAQSSARAGGVGYAGDEPFHLRHCSEPGPLIVRS